MVEIVSKGGNYLLNIGPMADGSIPEASVATLHGVGEWMRQNSESIYGTTASPLADPNWGRITAKGNLLFLHVFNWPADGVLRVAGLLNDAWEAHPLLAPGASLAVSKSFGTTLIKLPARGVNEADTVIVLKLNAPAKAEPTVITQGSDTPLTMDYSTAVTSGRAVKRFNRDGGFHIAKWAGPSDTIQWHVLVSQAGKYHLRIRYAAAGEWTGATYRVGLGDQTVAATVEMTGEGYQYKTFELKTLSLKAENLSVTIAPTAQLTHSLMYLQSLELVPDGPIMVE
jgi:alpha-L-fucosidase